MSDAPKFSPQEAESIKTMTVNKLIAMPIHARKGAILKIFRTLEDMTNEKARKHLGESLRLIDDSKERFNNKTILKLSEEFAEQTDVLEKDLMQRLEGFPYGAPLIAKYHELRAAVLRKMEVDLQTTVEQSKQQIKDVVSGIYQRHFVLRDLRKTLTAKALDALNDPVPEAALMAAFDKWDSEVGAMWDRVGDELLKLMKDTKDALSTTQVTVKAPNE